MRYKMKIKINDYLTQKSLKTEGMQIPDCEIDPETIKIIMINEVPPKNPEDNFYSKAPEPDYMKTTLALFRDAGVNVNSIEDILALGIYITTAVKTPKTEYTVDPAVIKEQLPILKSELALFPNLRVIMLMGDVAKKAVNMIAKEQTGKNVIPSESTYKIRSGEFYFGNTRVMPSYIMTGKNLLIENGKCDTISEDIKAAMKLI